MIEIKFWLDDIEGIRDFGILLLQKGFVYKLREKGDFAIFSIEIIGDEVISCTKTTTYLYRNQYCDFILSLGKGKSVINFKAFAIKIY